MGSTGQLIPEGCGLPARQWLMGTEAFEARMPHHDGIKALWETKWKFPVSSFFVWMEQAKQGPRKETRQS